MGGGGQGEPAPAGAAAHPAGGEAGAENGYNPAIHDSLDTLLIGLAHMASLSPHYMTILETVLTTKFVPFLPILLNPSNNAVQNDTKNKARAFAAFAISKLCEIDAEEAAAAIVDDFDDLGVDAIYFKAATDTLFIVQAKLKSSQTFTQEEALSFCQGIRKIVSLDFTGFNNNVIKRQMEIEDALETCSYIELVIAHTGSGISEHAQNVVADFLADDSHGEERFKSPVTNYDSTRVETDLLAAQALPRIDATLVLQPWTSDMAPRKTYFGFVPVSELVKLHNKHDKALYVKNIRNFLGQTTPVNQAIEETLASGPEKFAYLNNGVTALCEQIDPKDNKRAGKRLKLTGISIINGAQTIASSARFVQVNPSKDISSARVLITLIRADEDSDFGKAVTRARNHQNPVLTANFAALDDHQERLRRELAHLDLHYFYKAGQPDQSYNKDHIRIDEAAFALALLQDDPRVIVTMKKEPSRILNSSDPIYKGIFNQNLTGFKLANAARLFRYLQTRLTAEAVGTGTERAAYRHGAYALSFVFAKRLSGIIAAPKLIDEKKIATELSQPFDEARQAFWNATNSHLYMTPYGLFRNQSRSIPILRDTMIAHYGLAADPAIAPLRAKVTPGELYPHALFAYLAMKAPQIGNLT
jgi:hypothetical protein